MLGLVPAGGAGWEGGAAPSGGRGVLDLALTEPTRNHGGLCPSQGSTHALGAAQVFANHCGYFCASTWGQRGLKGVGGEMVATGLWYQSRAPGMWVQALALLREPPSLDSSAWGSIAVHNGADLAVAPRGEGESIRAGRALFPLGWAQTCWAGGGKWSG